MKILVSAYACDPTRGGEFLNGWNYAYNAKNGFQIWCLTTPEGKEGIEQRLSKDPIPSLRVIYVHIPKWIQSVKDRSPNYGVYFHYWYFQVQAKRLAVGLHKSVGFDVIHHATYGSLQLGTFLWKIDVPFLFGPLGGGQVAPGKFKRYFSRWWRLELQRKFVSKLLLDVLGSPRRALRRSAITLVVNEETFSMAQKYGASNIYYSPCTLLPDTFGPGVIPERSREGTMRLLWVGRLLARKGLRLVLEALSQMEKDIPISLTIIGDGPQETELPVWIDELQLNSWVRWEGRQSLGRVCEAYASHDVFIYCSLRESLGSQILESMAYGLPTIIFNLHGAKKFVPAHAAMKIDVADPEQTVALVCEAIAYLYHHPTERIELGKRAFEAAKEFTWSNGMKSINHYYKMIK